MSYPKAVTTAKILRHVFPWHRSYIMVIYAFVASVMEITQLRFSIEAAYYITIIIDSLVSGISPIRHSLNLTSPQTCRSLFHHIDLMAHFSWVIDTPVHREAMEAHWIRIHDFWHNLSKGWLYDFCGRMQVFRASLHPIILGRALLIISMPLASHCSRRCRLHFRTILRFSEYIGANQQVVILVYFITKGLDE